MCPLYYLGSPHTKTSTANQLKFKFHWVSCVEVNKPNYSFTTLMADSRRSPHHLQDLPTQEEFGAAPHPGHPILHADHPALSDPTGVCPEPQGAVNLLNIGQHHHPGEHGSDL